MAQEEQANSEENYGAIDGCHVLVGLMNSNAFLRNDDTSLFFCSKVKFLYLKVKIEFVDVLT